MIIPLEAETLRVELDFDSALALLTRLAEQFQRNDKRIYLAQVIETQLSSGLLELLDELTNRSRLAGYLSRSWDGKICCGYCEAKYPELDDEAWDEARKNGEIDVEHTEYCPVRCAQEMLAELRKGKEQVESGP